MTKYSTVPTTRSSPWYIQLLLGLSAWVSAAFLLGGMAAVLGTSDLDSLTILGVVLVGLALFIKKKTDSIFFNQLAFALSAAGQVGIILGFGNLLDAAFAVAVVMLILELVLLFLFPNFLHRVISAVLVVISLRIMLAELDLDFYNDILALAAAGVSVYLWNAKDWVADLQVKRALQYALSVTAFALLWFSGEGYYTSRPLLAVADVVSSVIGAGLIAYQARTIMRHLEYTWMSWRGVAVACTLLILLIPAFTIPALLLAILFVIIGFQYKVRLLQGVAILAAIGSMSYYYYSLEITLLEKSILMAMTGVFLLVLRGIYLWYKKPTEVQV